MCRIQLDSKELCEYKGTLRLLPPSLFRPLQTMSLPLTFRGQNAALLLTLALVYHFDYVGTIKKSSINKFAADCQGHVA